MVPNAPLSALSLATDLGVLIWNEGDVSGIGSDDIRQLCVIDPDSWSAFTMRVEDRYLIFYNSTQSSPRQNSVVMHELSHIILGHELTSASLTTDGYFVPTTYNQDEEDEADWLAGTLLLPRPSLLKIRYNNMSDEEARDVYSVSQQMLTWRFRMTGVDYQISNSRQK